MPWPEHPSDLVVRAFHYKQAGQWTYARTAYLQAAGLIRHVQPALEAACLALAWECAERAAGRVSALEVE